MIDFWNMKYKPGGEYRKIDGTIDPHPYLEKGGARYSIGGISFIWAVLTALAVWGLVAIWT